MGLGCDLDIKTCKAPLPNSNVYPKAENQLMEDMKMGREVP